MNRQKGKRIKRIVETIINREANGWPPPCPCFFYQPVRPEKKSKVTTEKGGA